MSKFVKIIICKKELKIINKIIGILKLIFNYNLYKILNK